MSQNRRKCKLLYKQRTSKTQLDRYSRNQHRTGKEGTVVIGKMRSLSVLLLGFTLSAVAAPVDQGSRDEDGDFVKVNIYCNC